MFSNSSSLRVALKLELGGVRDVAHVIISNEQTQAVFELCILYFQLEIKTSVVVPCGALNSLPCISILNKCNSCYIYFFGAFMTVGFTTFLKQSGAQLMARRREESCIFYYLS